MHTRARSCLVGLFLAALFLITVITFPHIDYSEPNPFFYLQHLTPLYYLCLAISFTVAVFYGRGVLSIFAAIIFSLLLLWTPDLMLVQPWVMDTYPFVSQAVYVTRNGYLGPYQANALLETPALALTFASFLSSTGINAFALVKIFPALLTVVLVGLLYLIAKQIGVKEKPVLAPLLFAAVLWPNVMHFSRQAFSLVFYFAAWFFMLKLIQEKNRKIFVMLVSQCVLLTIAHPGASFFFITNMASVLVLGSFLRKMKPKEHRLLINTFCFSVVSWVAWNVYTLSGAKSIRILTEMSSRVAASLVEHPQEMSGIEMIFVGYTPTYSTIIDVRLGLTAFVFFGAIMSSIIVYRHSKDKDTALVIISWLASNIFSALPFLSAGLPLKTRPTLFSFIAWAPIGAIAYQVLNKKKISKLVFISAFVLLPAFLMPIVKYAPLPFTYPTSQELLSMTFAASWFNGSRVVYLEASPPYASVYIQCKIEEPEMVTLDTWYSPGQGLDQDVADGYPILVTYRVITRDAFWSYNPSMYDIVMSLTSQEELRNKVYDSGWPFQVLMPELTDG